MTVAHSLFNVFVLPFLVVWRTLRLFFRPIAYIGYLASLPLRISYKVTTWPVRTFIKIVLRFDSLLPAIVIVALVGVLTGLTLHGLNLLLTRSLRLYPPLRHAEPPSQTSTPTPSSIRPLSPFLLPVSPIQLPESSGMWSPTKKNNYKKQMRLLMAQRQDQLIAMHEEEKKRRMVKEALTRSRQEQQLHLDQPVLTQLPKPRLSLFTQSDPGQGSPACRYDSDYSSLNNVTIPRSSAGSIGLGLGGTNSWDDARAMGLSSPTSATGAGGGFFFNDTILEEEEDSDF